MTQRSEDSARSAPLPLHRSAPATPGASAAAKDAAPDLGYLPWAADASGRRVGDLSAWCAFTGQTDEQARGWGWLDALHTTDRTASARAWSKAVRDGTPYERSEWARRADGLYCLLLSRAVPSRDSSGEVYAWTGFSVDLTERGQPQSQSRGLPHVLSARTPEAMAGPVTEPEQCDTDEPDEPDESDNLVKAADVDARRDARRFRALIERSSDAIALLDEHGVIEYASPSTQRVLGYDAAETLGASLSDFLHEDDLPTAHEWLATLRDQPGVAHPLACRVYRPDGALRWLEGVGANLLHDAALGAIVFNYRDVTDQQALARAAAERAAQLEATFDALTDAVIVYDAQGRTRRLNAAARVLLGLDSPDDQLASLALSGRPLIERAARFTMRDAQGAPLAPEDWPQSRIRAGEALTGASAVEVWLSVAHGREALLSVSGAPIRDADGATTGSVVILRDVTGQRRLERRTHEALDALMAMAEALVVPVSEATNPVAVTDQAESDESSEPLESPESPESLPTELGERLAAMIASVLGCARVTLYVSPRQGELMAPVAAFGLTLAQEHRWRLGEPSPAFLRNHLSTEQAPRTQMGEVTLVDYRQPPFRDLPNPLGVTTLLMAPLVIEGAVIGLLNADHGGVPHIFTPAEVRLAGAVARLVAMVIERERLLRERAESHASERALRAANQRMDEFLSVASHELRTPLTGALANVQLSARQLQRLISDLRAVEANAALLRQTERASEMLARAEQQMRRQNRLVGDLLDVSRIRAGKLEMRMEPCDLVSTTREAVEEQQLAHPQRVITFTAPELPVMAQADPDRVGQIVTNYLTNALRYAPAERPITVRVEQLLGGANGDVVSVSVADCGPGLSAEQQAHIWEQFQQVEGAERQQAAAKGLGLGLYISREIVERHGGVCGVESAPGMGATFWFTLPLAR